MENREGNARAKEADKPGIDSEAQISSIPEQKNTVPVISPLGDIGGIRDLLINPLISEVRSLKDSMEKNYSCLDQKYEKLEEAITTQREKLTSDILKLEEIITSQKRKISMEMSYKLEENKRALEKMTQENDHL